MEKTIAGICAAIAVGLVTLGLASCGNMGAKPVPAKTAAQQIHEATQTIPATPESIEEAMAETQRNARSQREKWAGRPFEDFERSVYLEPWEGGKYIVSGDVAIADRKQLMEFYDTYIQQNTADSGPGRLVVNLANGLDTIWNGTQRKQLSYCVSTAFGNNYAKVVGDMESATGAWEQVADVDFVHMPSQDANCTASNGNVLFDVRPVDVGGQYLARAFFPNEPRAARNVLVDASAFGMSPAEKLQLAGILRHELGHTLGWRHEHTRPQSGACFEDNGWRPLTSYDRFSVMHYPQCNGGGDWSLQLTTFDKSGAACVYGPAQGFQIDTQICSGTVAPAPSAPQVKVNNDQRLTKNQEKQYGPFKVVPGSRFEARIMGDGRTPGDPDLYVRFGQAPLRTRGGYACRPYTSGADETCSLDVPAGQTQAFVMVHGFSAAAYDLAVTFKSKP